MIVRDNVFPLWRTWERLIDNNLWQWREFHVVNLNEIDIIQAHPSETFIHTLQGPLVRKIEHQFGLWQVSSHLSRIINGTFQHVDAFTLVAR